MADQNRGRLITFSGPDGAGKTTQVATLRRRLEERGEGCHAYEFRADDFGAAGRQRIDKILSSQTRWVFTRLRMDWNRRYPLLDQFVHDPSLHTPAVALAAALVFAGSSLQVAEFGLEPLLRAGVNVVCDRYWFDDLAFRHLWVDEDLMARLYGAVPVPDIAFLLRAPPELCAYRNRGRPDEQNPILNDPVMVRRMHRKFDEVGRRNGLTAIDGTRHPRDVTDEICAHIAARMNWAGSPDASAAAG